MFVSSNQHKENTDILKTKEQIATIWKHILSEPKYNRYYTELGFEKLEDMFQWFNELPGYIVSATIAPTNRAFELAFENKDIDENVIKRFKNIKEETEPQKMLQAWRLISDVPAHKEATRYLLDTKLYEYYCIVHSLIRELSAYINDEEDDYEFIFNTADATNTVKNIYEHLNNHDIDCIIELLTNIAAYHKNKCYYKEADSDYKDKAERSYSLLIKMFSEGKPLHIDMTEVKEIINEE